VTSSTTTSPPPSRVPDQQVVALFGPTASGKTAVAGVLRERLGAEVISADSAALYCGLPILTAAPEYPARLVGIVPLDEDVSVGSFQRLAHRAIDESLAAGAPAVVVGGTGLYFRAALSGMTIPPPPAPGVRERWLGVYDESGPDATYGMLALRDPAAAARIHPNDRRRVIRALELTESGSSLAPDEDRLWSRDLRRPTLIVGLDVALPHLDERIAVRTEEMIERGVAGEARTAWSGALAPAARKVLGLEAFATLPLDEARQTVIAATRRLARYQRKWLRRLPVDGTLDADRPPGEIADEIVALARAGERLPRR
jgi:tRNA dimethylallyltransferase